MFGRVFSVESGVVYTYQQTLSTGGLAVGRIVKETTKMLGMTLRVKYVIKKSLPEADNGDTCMKSELDRVGKEIDDVCTKKQMEYEYGK